MSQSKQQTALVSSPAGEQKSFEQHRNYHVKVWVSGARGGGKVPEDLEWGTNPKQWQEEFGSALPVPETKATQ